MTDIVQKLSDFCHTLRHDGVDYGDYIEQITCLLFIKMADELPPPEESATDAIGELETTVKELNAVLVPLENGTGTKV